MHQGEDIITAEAAGTLDGLFRERARRSPDSVAYKQFNKETSEWDEYSWAEIAAEINRWHQAMANSGLEPGSRAALLMRNSVEWVIGEQAALAYGLIVVPLYCDDRPDNIAYILNDSATHLLMANTAMWRRVQKACSGVESLDCVVVVPVDGDVKGITENKQVHLLENWLPTIASVPVPPPKKPEDLATIVYTSGTTGRPKGVMLSHHNILFTTHAAIKTFAVYTDDLFLSFLPTSHTFERTVGYYLALMAGATTAYSRSVPLLGEDMQHHKPTCLIAVPRIFERVHSRIMQKLEKGSGLARGLFSLTTNVGWWRFERIQGRGGFIKNSLSLLLWPMCNALVAKKVRALMGGNIRLPISGGAALSAGVAHDIIGLGIPIVQGYGLTETSPIISGNPPDNNDPDSVGVPLIGIDVRIGENDELQVNTPGMMLGYWNNHAATAEVIDPDGWLHTGDQARIENDHIYITGRLKDILVLSNGEKVPPGDMEAAIAMDSLIEQNMVIGEGQSFMSAIIVLNKEEWLPLANKFVIDPYKHENVNDPKIHSELINRIRKLLHEFPSYAKIRKVIVTLEPWSVENDLMTPTLKVKRNKVIALYQGAIDEIYS